MASSTTSPTKPRSEEHTSELQSPCNLVCRLLLEKKKHLQFLLMKETTPCSILFPLLVPSGKWLTPMASPFSSVFFFFNDTPTTEIYPLPLPDALPIFFRFWVAQRFQRCDKGPTALWALAPEVPIFQSLPHQPLSRRMHPHEQGAITYNQRDHRRHRGAHRISQRIPLPRTLPRFRPPVPALHRYFP